jgi:hypothetical protein
MHLKVGTTVAKVEKPGRLRVRSASLLSGDAERQRK